MGNMRTGIITGCGRGIGLASAALQLQEGGRVFGISRSKTKAVVGLLRKYPETFVFKECDIGQRDNLRATLREAFFAFDRIDYAVCNAGVRSRLPLDQASIEDYLEIYKVNTLSQIDIGKQLIESACSRRARLNLLFLTSIVGPSGFSDLSVYASSKSALEGFVRSIAVEYARRGIIANCLAPGFVRSSYFNDFKRRRSELYDWTLSRTPMGRWGSCHEIASIIQFLVSEKNTYMTGSVVFSDGGWSSS
jgi:NAD(P)-dependent dehydrogenase (short-subunit alcohol dehydrogenase family)